jgi:glycolate dehydrogenase FAD-binding subunit
VITALDRAQTELADIVGAGRVVTDETSCAALSVDGKTPGIVAYPSSAEQVAQVLGYASQEKLAVIPCRNGTKLAIGNCPERFDIALSLKDLNRVWHYEPADLTVSVEPGMKFGDFQHFVARHGLWLPLDPPGGGRASLGGIVATNSAGPLRLRFGTPRDMVLGMKVATTEGKVIKTGGRVVKNVAGYDLTKLMLGSFGTLGVMVEVSFKLYPLSVDRATFVLAFDSLESTRDFRRQLLRSPLDPMRMVLMDEVAFKLVAGDSAAKGETSRFKIWVEAGGSPRVVERSGNVLEELSRRAGGQMLRLDSDTALQGWSRIADLHTWLAELYPHIIILTAALPISSCEDILECAYQEAEKTRWACFGFTGSGIVHLCVPDELAPAEAAALIGRVRTKSQALGGTLVVERCPSAIKDGVDIWGATGDDFEVMRKLKEAWDPNRVLSPGRFVGRL